MDRVRPLLNSSATRDKVQGLRSVLSQVAEGDASSAVYFADVVKLVFERDLEVREMAASYLIMFSHNEPELTLMIVNAVQKMLRDTSAVVRVQALRLISALRVPTIVPIVVHLISEVMNDPNHLVRAACFQAIGTCYQIDPSLGPELLEILGEMLSLPRQTQGDFIVAGWGLAVLAMNWPQRIDLLHGCFRVYVPHLVEFDEWCLVSFLPMLVRYCRHYLAPRTPDVDLLIESVKPLLYSLNTAVVVEAAAVLLYCEAPQLEDVVERLVNLQHSALVWSSLVSFASQRPDLFSKHRTRIIAESSTSHDPFSRIAALKIALLCTEQELSKQELSLLQFCCVAWSEDLESLRASMSCIASLVGTSLVGKTTSWLVGLATDRNQSPQLISESLMALRVLVQQNSDKEKAVPLLRKMIAIVLGNKTLLPLAKATIVWLVGVHTRQIPAEATEMLRQLLADPEFALQPEEVRAQTIELAAKINTAFKNDPSKFDARVPKMFGFALQLAKFDANIDIRDRARMFETLDNADNNMATLLLQTAQPNPKLFGIAGSAAFTIDTLSGYFGRPMDGYVALEDWTTNPSPDDWRVVKIGEKKEEAEVTKTVESKAVEKVKGMSLEEFLDPKSKLENNSGESSADSDAESESGSDSDAKSEDQEERDKSNLLD